MEVAPEVATVEEAGLELQEVAMLEEAEAEADRMQPVQVAPCLCLEMA